MSNIAFKRIARDVSALTHNDALEQQGIYYFTNESNMTEGIALLIGQPDTPYFGGFYYFSIKFPADYPWSPIKVQTLTQDGQTRFNPNMYREGKVCLSILNTWHDGPQWSGVQTLESVLLVIMSDVLNANPLQNEPAYSRCGQSPEAIMYNTLIWHANVHTAIIGMLTEPPLFAAPYIEIMRAEFAKRRTAILERTVASIDDNDGKTGVCRLFTMSNRYNFKGLAEKLMAIKN